MPITLTDDQWERLGQAADTLDNLQTALTVMKTVPDRTHVEALRGAMPAAVREVMSIISEVEDGD